MSHATAPLTEVLTIEGHAVCVATILTSAGFTASITVPAGSPLGFRSLVASRAHAWCKVQNVEHEDATTHHRWLPDGEHLLIEGTGWKPETRDLLHLSLCLQGKQENVHATVTEDLETPLPPLRRHSLPESIRVSDLPETLLAQTR